MRHLIKVYFFIFILFSSCEKSKYNDIIMEVIEIETSLKKSEKKKIQNLTIDEFLNSSFIKKSDIIEDEKLIEYFKSIEIEEPNYITEIIYVTLYKKINNSSLNIESQINDMRIRINDEKDKLEKKINRYNEYLNRFSINDTIVIRMKIDGNSSIEYAFPENNNWTYNDKNDLVFEAEILEENKNDKLYLVKVLKKNKENILWLQNKVQLGDTIPINIESNIIESNNMR